LAWELLARGASGLVSFGIAGGLDPALRSGDLVIGSTVISGGTRYDADAAYLENLSTALPRAYLGAVLGSDKILLNSAQKAEAFAATGALAVDMESQAVAEIAKAANKPFAVLRAIADPADFSLPPMVAQGLDPNGRPRLAPILMGLALNPWHLPGLIATGQASSQGLGALLRCGGVGLLSLGSFARVDVGHSLLHMA
jgi:hopanoid-associated phosphorylase